MSSYQNRLRLQRKSSSLAGRPRCSVPRRHVLLVVYAPRGFHLFCLRGKVSQIRTAFIAVIASIGRYVAASQKGSVDGSSSVTLFPDRGFPLCYVFHGGKHHAPRILYRMGAYALAYAPESVFAEQLAQQKLMIVRYRTGRRCGSGKRGEPSVPVQDTYRAMKQVLVRRRALVRGGAYLVAVREHQTAVMCQGCNSRTEALPREAEHHKRCVDHKFCLCMKCIDNSREERKLDRNASIDIYRLLTKMMERMDRLAYLKLELRYEHWKQLSRKAHQGWCSWK
jgi:hypothetical protein